MGLNCIISSFCLPGNHGRKPCFPLAFFRAAFRADAEPSELSAEVDRLQRELESKGYHVSFGIAVREKTQGALDMRELVSAAETGMFAAKQAFYRRAENDRRER